MTMTAELIERLEKASGPDRKLDDAIKIAHAGHLIAAGATAEETKRAVSGDLYDDALPYTASMDAALTLVPTDWGLILSGPHRGGWRACLEHAHYLPSVAAGYCPTPAIAVSAVALKARKMKADANAPIIRNSELTQ